MTQALTQRTDGGRRLARLTVEKFEAMVAAGLLTKRDRVELERFTVGLRTGRCQLTFSPGEKVAGTAG
jgi:hypothetical protein